jgi:uncharacterized metal-binding protein
MSKGIVHARATLALAAAGGLFAYTQGQPLPQVLALAGGTLSGLLLTPDLDVDDGCISNEIVRNVLGRRAERAWALFWRPYGLMLPHRSRLSHLPVLGTAIRLIYLAILPALIWWLTNAALAAGVLTNGLLANGLFAAGIFSSAMATVAALTQPALPAWTAWAVGGLALADTLHYLMDQIF